VCARRYAPGALQSVPRFSESTLFCAGWCSSLDHVVTALSLARSIENEIAFLSVDYQSPGAEGSGCVYVNNSSKIAAVLPRSEVGLLAADVSVAATDFHGKERPYSAIADLDPKLRKSFL